jgi:hypothetical protein
MPTFDPLNPQNGQNVDADFLRNQFNSLKGLIDTVPPGQVTQTNSTTSGPFVIASGPQGDAGQRWPAGTARADRRSQQHGPEQRHRRHLCQ